MKVGLFDGETFQFENNYSSSYSWSNEDRIIVSDFNGDGFPELHNIGMRNNYTSVIKSFNSKQNLFVKTITNGLNQKTAFEYKPITDNACYTETATSNPAFNAPAL